MRQVAVFLSMTNSKYKNLFFDFDDTLWAFSLNARDAFEEVYHLYGLDRFFHSFDEFFTIYTQRNDVLWEDYGRGSISKEELNRARFGYPLEQVGVHDPQLVDDYMKAYFRIIPTRSKLMPHAQEVLQYLSTRYRLYILSNGFRETQYLKIEHSGLAPYFRRIILSEDIMANKPRPEIFHFALSATQSELHESLMIGDNFNADIAGARGVGMDQAYYNHRPYVRLPFRPTYEIFSLRDLMDFL